MKKHRPLTSFLALAGSAALIALAGCGGSDGFFDDDDDPINDVFAATNGNRLMRLSKNGFDTVNDVAITGLAVGETIRGMDFRPANSQLYALGSTGQLYTLDTATGAATAVGAPLAITGTAVGFDFNPSVDRIRIITDEEENLRVNPDTGDLAATDTALTPASFYVGAAYTPAGAGNPTTLFAIDAGTNRLVLQGGVDGTPSPNGGVMTVVGPLLFDASTTCGFDIDTSGNAYVLTLNGGGTSSIYRLDLQSGEGEKLDDFAFGITAMAVLT